MKIIFGKQIYDIHVGDDYSIAHIKSILSQETCYDTIRLVSAGKTLSDETIVHHLPGGIHAKLVMIASHSNDIIVPNPSDVRVRDDLTIKPSSTSSSASAKKAKIVYKPSDFLKDGYGFHGINTLPGLPDEEHAHQILASLASDPGFLSVMKLHGWQVGSLGELYPEGAVGVSEVCVLGLNKNQGQEILLRIRTDDMQGFRKMLTIREVLCHELAHMMYSEHDDRFYMLMRQIQREVIEMDWTKSRYHTLGSIRSYPRWHDDDDSDDHEGVHEAKVTSSSSSSSAVNDMNMIVDSIDDNIPPSLSPSSASTVIEQQSLSIPEPMIIAGDPSPDVLEPDLISSSSSSADHEHELSSPSSSSTDVDHELSSLLARVHHHHITAMERLDASTAAAYAQDHILSQEKPLAFIQHLRSFTQRQLRVAASSSSSSSLDMLSSSAQAMEDWLWTMKLLQKIFTNAKDSIILNHRHHDHVDDDKHHRMINKDSKSFRRLLHVYDDHIDDDDGGVSSSLSLYNMLRLAGFQDEALHLHARTIDPAFLYFAIDIIQTVIQ